MSLITEFRIRSSGLALWETQQACPEMEFQVIREVGTDPQRPFMFVWVRGVETDAFEAALEADPTVFEYERFTELEDQTLYRFRVSEETEVVMYPVWVELGAEPLETRWRDGWWNGRMRFPDRDALTKYREHCDAHGVDFELKRMYTDERRETGEEPLTEQQREALSVASGAGYFAVPREASLADVAEELDLSSQAVSERLRRGQGRLAEHYLS